MSSNLLNIPVNRIDGTPATLAEFAGNVLLVVNVASKCGLTPQYEGLERLYERNRDRGFAVLGFPANDFGAQEPGTNGEIAAFCATSYGVQFPMFEKIAVTGSGRHPLYEALVAAAPAPAGAPNAASSDISWNFEKFLIARDGSVAARFAPSTPPDDPKLLEAIEAELGR